LEAWLGRGLGAEIRGGSLQGEGWRRLEEGRRWKEEKGQPPWPGGTPGGGGSTSMAWGVSLGGFEELCNICGGQLLGCGQFGFNHSEASMEG